MKMLITPLVVDLYHDNEVGNDGNELAGFRAFKAAGGVGVIHKASQGTQTIDGAYGRRRSLVLEAGLLWGAYHFNTGEDAGAQVAHFFQCARPDDNTLMAIDFEDNPRSNMSIAQLRTFVSLADALLGRKLLIYGGNRLKENLPKADPFFASHRLWLCQYGPKPKLPKPWSEYWIWQYAADGEGPQPHHVAGIPGNPDLNTSQRTPEQLAKEWAGA